RQARNVHHLAAGETVILARLARLETEGRHAHADQVGTVDAFEAFGDHGAYALQLGALGRPVAGGAGAVFLAADHDGANAVLLVALGRVEDGHGLALPVRVLVIDGV